MERRSEIIRLRWGDLKLRRDGSIVLKTRVKGGTDLSTELRDPNAKAALLDSLRASWVATYAAAAPSPRS